ncbi:MAG: hypothetical protein ACJA16_004666 [Akkermansiaceae bacterium]|jgi:uncharacterized protein (DUF1501 family)
MKTNRRNFLARSAAAGVISLGASVPAFLSSAAAAATAQQQSDKDGRILVLIELAGGNDGLNTVIPFSNDAYLKARPGTKIGEGAVLKLDDELGLHAQMGGMKALYDAGSLGIVQGVGYPNPNRSHFRSMDIWHSARPTDEEFRGTGWLGRALDETEQQHAGRLPALAVGTDRLPRALLGHKINVPMLRSIDAFKWNSGGGPAADRERRRALIEKIAAKSAAGNSTLDFLRKTTTTAALTAKRLGALGDQYQTKANYPANGLGQKLKTVAQLITADLGTRIFYVSLGGFDTHSQQEGAHAALLGELSSALSAFCKDMEDHKLRERILVATYSEFGRRVQENGSLGTDHGTASQMFLVTPEGHKKSKAGLIGKHPSLTDLDKEGDMKFHTDFRSVYASLLENWLEFPSEKVLGGNFKKLDFV